MRNNIFIAIIICFLCSSANSATTGGGLSFLNIAATAKMNSLGNTMFSELGSPSAIILNPSNSWSSSNYKLSFNNIWFNQHLDAKINHMFLGFKRKQSQFSLGLIQYGVKDIEGYDEYGYFNDYFDFSDLAFILGYSYRVSNIYWGISTALISENFSNIGYDKTYFYQYDIGFSYTKIPLKLIDLSIGVSMKNVFDQNFKIQNSMNSNNIIGSMVSFNIKDFVYKGYFDVLFQKILGVYSGRFGSELQYNYKGLGGALYLGYNDFRFTSLDIFSLSETNQYNSQLKWGIGIDIPIKERLFSIVYGQSLPGKETRMDSQFMTITITKHTKH